MLLKAKSLKTDDLTLTAVALQDHIIHSLKIQSLSLTDSFKKKQRDEWNSCKQSRKKTVKSVIDTGLKPTKPDLRKQKEDREDLERDYVLESAPPPLTLAQKLGLVEGPVLPLTTSEWEKVKERSVQQGDSTQPCVICREEFRLQQQVLLSCSHIFHRVCLQAFERFSGKKTCPMCRKEQYQTRVIHDGARLYKLKCATRIQAYWRGYIVRKWYKHLRQTVPPKDKKLRKKFYEEKLQEISNKLVKYCDTSTDELFAEINHSIAVSRNILQKFEEKYHHYDISEDEWEKIQLKALQWEILDCPICITPLHYSNNSFSATEDKSSHHSSRQIVLLSCSHVFHNTCLHAFEEFSVEETPVCPLCRSLYQKRTL
ncbi:RING finger protein 32 [Latimeria chalumnae]